MSDLLIVNCGTATIKATLFRADGSRLSAQTDCSSDYGAAIRSIIEQLQQKGSFQLKAIGHRVVHGGDRFTCATLIDDQLLAQLRKLSPLAPLHNPPALEGIEATRRLFPGLPQVAVFDTAFHTTIPPQAAHYAIPHKLAKQHQIKRYGFHGTAHAYLAQRYAQERSPNQKLITLHLGSGCSLTAIENGRSIDTTMGFTPLEGLIMATRSGSIDPAIVAYLAEQEKQTPSQVISLLNEKSGLLGIAGSGDMRQLLKSTEPQAQLAVDMFIYSLLKHLGSLLAILQGADALIFSGGIGENSPLIRSRLLSHLSWLNVQLDPKANDSCTTLSPGQLQTISLPSSSMEVLVIGADENRLIADEVQSLIG
jgi:acetate kinase